MQLSLFLRYCECGKGPTPKPGPPAGNDTWSNYEIAGMQVMSVVGGKDASNYQKVVIMLHGGGEDGTMWEYQYEEGWFGSLTGMKYVFPTSAYPSHVWYQSYKNGCGLLDDCAYNISSIQGIKSAYSMSKALMAFGTFGWGEIDVFTFHVFPSRRFATRFIYFLRFIRTLFLFKGPL